MTQITTDRIIGENPCLRPSRFGRQEFNLWLLINLRPIANDELGGILRPDKIF